MKKIFLLSTFYFLLATLSPSAMAQHFESSSYIIDWGNFNMTSGSKTSTNYNLTDTVGQNAPGQYDSQGYIVKSGFQYIYENRIPFSFTISDLSVELGTLVPGVASTATNVITVSTPSGHGYDILAIQNHPLSQNTGTTIPNTTCDSGNCTPTTSDTWTSNSAYGFGFNATGVGTTSYFQNDSYYRPFASSQYSETPQAIMSHHLPAEDHQATITYKAIIPPTQSSGDYENSITFIAVPKY